AAHHRGVVHRDVKPANILFDETGAVKLVDFGIASFGDRDLTSSGTQIGTPAYMAPEQLRGRVADVRADLYAVGATLFETATGTRLHDHERTPAQIEAEVAGATGDAALAAAIARAVAQLPADRFASARAFADALRGEPAPRPRASHRWLVAAAAMIVLAGTAAALVARRHRGSTAGDPGELRTIAVLRFVDHTGEPRLDFAASGVPHILGSELRTIPELKVIAYYDLVDRLGDAAAPDARWQAAARALGAQLTARGELFADPAGVRIVVDIASIDGASVGRFERITSVDKVAPATREIARDVARAAFGRALPAAGPSRQFEIERNLQLAIAALERQDFAEADAELQKVELQAPDLAEAQYYRALLDWWLSRDVDGPAARALAGNLDPAQRGFMEGLRLVNQRDHLTPAIAYFRDLARRFPDHRDIQYGLFESLYHGGFPADAIGVYRQLGERFPSFRLGLKHALAYYVNTADDAGMRWAIGRLDPAQRDAVLWQARAFVARRDYAGAIDLLRRHDTRDPAARQDVRRELAGIYALARQLPLALDIAADWPKTDLPHHAAALLGLALARGRTAEAASWSETAAAAAQLATGEDQRDRGWLELAAIELPDGNRARLERIRRGLGSHGGINSAIARVLIAGVLADADALDAARKAEFPEVVAVADAFVAESASDWQRAKDAWTRAVTAAADGDYLVVERLGVARAARELGDHAGVLAACDEVIRPRRFTWAWGAAVGTCLVWSQEAATALGRADDARAFARQLAELHG
ncbi:MAG: protein kinase domain-containing protein, partial [Acidobacteriota bacterium]